MRWYRSAGFATVLAPDDGAELFQCHASLPNLQQGADDGSHHVAQETIRLDTKHQQSVLLKPACLHDLAVVGLHLGMHLRETCEVLIIKEDIGGFLHLCDVQIPIKEIGIVYVERILGTCDVIMVGARNGVKTGVHLGRDLPNSINDDVLRQEGIHLMRQCFRVGNRLLDIEMGVVVPSMYARVGTPTACDGDCLSQLEAQAVLYRSLHAIGVRLDLVTMVTAAVVGQMDEISRHLSCLKAQK